MFFGLALIIIGSVILLQNLGLLPVGAWPIIWPLLLIALGLALIARRRRSV